MKKYFILLQISVALSVIAAAQNVGIGTNTPDPSAKLHIVSTSSGVLIPQLTTTQVGSIVNPANGLLVYDSSFKVLMINAGTPAAPNFTPIVTAKFGWLTGGNDNIGAANFLGTTQNNSLRFRTNNIERMMVDSNGKFGVGVSDPLAAKFHISSAGDNEVLRLQSTFPLINLYAGNNLHSTIWANGSYLDLSTASGSNLGLSFSPNASQQMTIKYNGDVGIGTVSPAEKLHVAGNMKADTIKPNAVKFTPNAGAGKLLTSDATGNASWQERSAGGGVGFGSWGDCNMNGVSEYDPVADTSAANGDWFGSSVSISGNYAIIGAPFDDVGANVNQGSVSIYQFNGSSWVLMQKITDATGAAGDGFGSGVYMSGNYAIIGAPYDDVGANVNQGSASIYQWNGSSWVLMQKITDATGAALDFFGFSVSISGNSATMGAYGDDVGANNEQGSASIYQWNGSSWVLMQKITDATGAASDFFGFSVSISGNYAIVGAYGDDVGANNEQGSASIYLRVGLGWQKLQYVTDPGGNALDGFGTATTIDGANQRFLIGDYFYALGSGKAIFGKVN